MSNLKHARQLLGLMKMSVGFWVQGFASCCMPPSEASLSSLFATTPSLHSYVYAAVSKSVTQTPMFTSRATMVLSGPLLGALQPNVIIRKDTLLPADVCERKWMTTTSAAHLVAIVCKQRVGQPQLALERGVRVLIIARHAQHHRARLWRPARVWVS